MRLAASRRMLKSLRETFAMALAIPMGVLAALRPDSWIDRTALTIAVFGQALPGFWFALILMFVFGLFLRLLPISGSDSLAHFILPAIALAYYAGIARRMWADPEPNGDSSRVSVPPALVSVERENIMHELKESTT